MSERLPLARASKLAERLLGELSSICNRIAIAGSIRRRRDFVGDIDLVLIPNNPAELHERLQRHCRIITGTSLGAQNIKCEMATSVQLDIFIAHNASADLFKADPTNWGTVLLCRTGSMQHNIALATRCESMGLKWHTYRGIFRGDELIASATEESIYAAVDLKFQPPEDRERLHE